MIARIGEHSHLPDSLEPDDVRGIRSFLADCPGFCGGYHLLEPATGRAPSLTLWQDEAALASAEHAMNEPTGPADGRISHQTKPHVRIAQGAAVF